MAVTDGRGSARHSAPDKESITTQQQAQDKRGLAQPSQHDSHSNEIKGQEVCLFEDESVFIFRHDYYKLVFQLRKV